MKYLSLFSGIGAFEKALKNQGIPFELVGFSEIDKYAVKSYCKIHGVPEELNLGDITKIDETQLPKVDLITYGFPCQDISLAGRQQGLFHDDGSLTRSGLFFDALRIVEHTQPIVAIAENVKNLTGKKFAEQFNIVLESLENAGYNNYWKVLNAKDYGIPQNRERVFIISIRKDVDTGAFEFPEPFPLELRLKDMLEDVVDEKYFLTESKINKIANSNFAQEREMIQKGDVCGTLLARDYKDPKCVQVEPKVTQIGNCCPTKTRGNLNQGRIYDTNGLSPALNCMEGGNRQPFVTETPFRIRKLTPKECFRLMGFDDVDCEAASEVCSNTQLYKQAGNSIVVDVAEELFCMMFDEEGKFFV
jgi:DNA (cytosine-5)-methyltransferase 1